MGIWDDVDYRQCESCGATRHVASMDCRGPARIWTCAACSKRQTAALNELADLGQEFDAAPTTEGKT
jgi:ribosomal protein L37AE/L43A